MPILQSAPREAGRTHRRAIYRHPSASLPHRSSEELISMRRGHCTWKLFIDEGAGPFVGGKVMDDINIFTPAPVSSQAKSM